SGARATPRGARRARLGTTPAGAGASVLARVALVAGSGGAGDTSPPERARPPRTPACGRSTASTRPRWPPSAPPLRIARVRIGRRSLGREVLQESGELSLHFDHPLGGLEALGQL